MRVRLPILLYLALAILLPGLRATSVVPPSFSELVQDADAIYRGRVAAVQARRSPRPDGGSVINTFVTLTVERVLKGPAQTEVTLEFLGGTVGDETLEVSGMPKFSVGAEEYVFVQKNGVQFCPLVAFTHGRYRIRRDETAARDFIARDNGDPLTETAQVQQPMTPLPAPVRAASMAEAVSRALTPASFETRIAAEVERTASPARNN
jgi:hypothetical protein